MDNDVFDVVSAIMGGLGTIFVFEEMFVAGCLSKGFLTIEKYVLVWDEFIEGLGLGLLVDKNFEVKFTEEEDAFVVLGSLDVVLKFVWVWDGVVVGLGFSKGFITVKK